MEYKWKKQVYVGKPCGAFTGSGGCVWPGRSRGKPWGPAGGWEVGEQLQRDEKHGLGARGEYWDIQFFQGMASVKGLVEDKPGKSEQGVGIEHPAAKSRHLDWGHTQWAAELLHAKKVMMLDVRAIKPNYFSSPLQCTLTRAGWPPSPALVGTKETSPYRSSVWSPRSSELSGWGCDCPCLPPPLRKAWWLPACGVQILHHSPLRISRSQRLSHLNPATTPPGAPVPPINTCSLTCLSFCCPIWGPCWALYANSMHFSCCSIQSCFSWKRKTQREKDDEREQWRTRALLKEHIPTPTPSKWAPPAVSKGASLPNPEKEWKS